MSPFRTGVAQAAIIIVAWIAVFALGVIAIALGCLLVGALQ